MFMTASQRNLRFGIGLICALLLSVPTRAQEPGGGFGGPPGFGRPPGGFSGGFGRPGGGRGLLGELYNESTKAELEITDEQQAKIDALAEEQRNSNNDQFADIRQRFQDARTEEERNAIRDDMRERGETLRREADNQVRAVLTPEQATRLDQLRLHREGPAIFSRDSSIAEEFELTEEQKQEIQKLSEERMAARMQMRDMSSDDRRAFDEEWGQKYLTVLTPDQLARWNERLGPPPVVAAASATPSTTTPGAPGTTPAMVPPVRMILTEPVPQGTDPIVSFQIPPTSPPSMTDPATPGTPETTTEAVPAGDKKLSFNFRYAPWGDVLKLFANEANLSLDLNALPPGTFNYYDRGSYTATEALDILNGYLLPKGYCLIRRDGFLVCVNIDNPIPPNLIPIITPDEIETRGKNELLTVIFPLEGVDVDQIAHEVNEVKGPQGKVAGLKTSNSVLVTDIGSNLQRIKHLLAGVTGRGGPNDITFRAYQVRNIPVSDAEFIVRSLLGISTGVTNVSSSSEREENRRGMGPGGGGGDPRAMMQQRAQAQAAAQTREDSNKPRVTSDLRTNQLLVSATPAQHTLIDDALRTIDLAGDESQFSPTSSRPFLKVYTISSSDTREVTKTINSLIPGVVVNDDVRNGKIHIQATPDQHRQVETLIAQVEGLGGAQQMAVFRLSALDPSSATTTIRSMFQNDSTSPVIEADLYGRQLLVRGSTEQIAQIKTLLSQLGEDGTGTRADRTDRVRTIPLSGRDPAELLPILERMWNTRNGSTIRIVDPTAKRPAPASPVAPRHPLDSAVPSAPARSGTTTPETNPDSVMATPRTLKKIPVMTVAQTTPQDEQPPAQTSPRLPAELPAGVTITIVGDELVISSSDPSQLNELEDLLQQTMQAVPPRITWTVFSLQSADATEAANMLKLLFPGSSVSASAASSSGFLGGLGSSASTLGSNLLGMTGLDSLGAAPQLKFIPDVRLNALFVTGPAAQVREVEEMLKVLDSESLGGDSLRDKVARMIPVNHASSDEVYNIVKDVYKSYIDPPRAQGNNPLAMLAAARGGGGGRGDAQEAQAKLAIGVDNTTSNLIVWADEPLFREVEALVISLDQAALEARRTVRVINLENTSSTVMQGAISSLMPQVKVSTTGSRPRTTSSSTTPSGSTPPSSSGGGDGDQMRQFFEQRMRERMQQGGGGAAPGGFGGGGFGGGGFGGNRPGGFGGGTNRGGAGRTGGGTGGRGGR